jgi:uncharacterized protein
VAKIEREWLIEPHGPTSDIKIPIATLSPDTGNSGKSLAVIAGMHGGEAAGLFASMDLMTKLTATEIFGQVKIVPIISMQSFYSRSLQISPIDYHEPHYLRPGVPDGSYTEHLIDMLFRAIRDVDAVLDLHGGELTQQLTPYASAPWRRQDDDLFKSCLELASCFDVGFIQRFDVSATGDEILGLPNALLEEGIPNIWTEIGRNGLPEDSTIKLQYEGIMRVLGKLGIVKGGAESTPNPRIVGPETWSVFANQSGVWRSKVSAGDRVEIGQELGTITDEFGSVKEQYYSPGTGIIQYRCTSPAINHLRKPYGYRWHSLLVQMVRDD